MITHLTTASQIKSNIRFLSDKIDDAKIDIYIDEAEQLNIKNQIGKALFTDVVSYVNADDKTVYPDYSCLLNGGVYRLKACNGKYRNLIFKGLRTSLQYYVYARMVKNLNYTATRKGIVNKGSEYSSAVELKERLVLEKDALCVADNYLSDCLTYLHAHKDQFPLFVGGTQQNRLNFKIIGGKK